jgi:cold shock CspA family protein
MSENELLDFCRIKKIFDKGFGFFTSLYYKENVFFHFSKIKDEAAKEKLENLQRGEIYVYFTSRLKEGKRKVSRIWLDIKDADAELLPKFKYRIIEELNSGRTNIFELAYVIKQLRINNLLNDGEFNKVLRSAKVVKIPSSVAAMLTEPELELFEGGSEFFKSYNSKKPLHEEWVSHIFETLKDAKQRSV